MYIHNANALPYLWPRQKVKPFFLVFPLFDISSIVSCWRRFCPTLPRNCCRIMKDGLIFRKKGRFVTVCPGERGESLTATGLLDLRSFCRWSRDRCSRHYGLWPNFSGQIRRWASFLRSSSFLSSAVTGPRPKREWRKRTPCEAARSVKSFSHAKIRSATSRFP